MGSREHLILDLPTTRKASAVAVVAVSLFFLSGGYSAMHEGTGRLYWFYLDAEWVPPALLSGAVLFCAAYLAWIAVGLSERRGAWWLLTCLFGYMGVDEIVSIHERIEALAGVDWEELYTPIMIVGAVAFLWVLPELPDRLRVTWCLGAGAWAVAQVFEKLQWHRDILVHPWMILPEETLELTGSTLWALTLLAYVRGFRPQTADHPVPGRYEPVLTSGLPWCSSPATDHD